MLIQAEMPNVNYYAYSTYNALISPLANWL